MSKNVRVTPWPPFKRAGTTISTRTSGDDVSLGGDLTVAGSITGASISAGAIILKETVDIYVDAATGNDSTGDGSLALPFKTIQKGVTETCKYRSNNTMTIHVADGTYVENIVFPSSAQGVIRIVGNTTTRDNVIIDGGGQTFPIKGFDLVNCGSITFTLSSVKLQNTYYGINCDNSYVVVDNVNFYNNRTGAIALNDSILRVTDDTGISAVDGNNTANSAGFATTGGSVLRITKAVTITRVNTGITCTNASQLGLSAVPVITLISGADNYAGIYIRDESLCSMKGVTVNGSQIDSNNIALQVNNSMVTIIAGSVFTFSNVKYGIQVNGSSVWNEGNICTWNYTNITTNAYISHESVHNSINTFGTTPTYYGDFEGGFSQTPGYDYRYPQLAPTLDTTFTFPATKGWILDAATTNHTTSDLIAINADIAVDGKAAIKETVVGIGDMTVWGNYVDITSGALSTMFKFVGGNRIDMSDNAANVADTLIFGELLTAKTSANGSASGWNFISVFANSSFGLGFADLDTTGSIRGFDFDLVSKNNTSGLEGFSGNLEQKTVASGGMKFISGKIKPNVAGISDVTFIYADNEGTQTANSFINVLDSGEASVGWTSLFNASSATATYGIQLPACATDAFSSLGGSISATLGAAQKITIDASSTTHTDFNGVVDLSLNTATNNSSAVNLLTVNTSTVGQNVYGLYNSVGSSAIITGTIANFYGTYNLVGKTGADISADTVNVYGTYNNASLTGSTDVGTRAVYGSFCSATGDAAGSSVAYGIYTTASGADTNWAAYHNGNVYVSGSLSLADGITNLPSLGITPTATGSIIDVALETEWTTGILLNADFASGTTQTGAITGLNIDFNSNLVAVADKDVSGSIIKMPALTQSTADTTDYIGYGITTSGAIVQDTLAGVINWTGAKIQMPNQTQTTGTVTSRGINVLGGTVTSGAAYGIDITMASATDTALKITTGKTVLGATTFSSAIAPASNDGAAIGVASTGEWSDLFLASGGVINFSNGDVTITHTSQTLTMLGGSYIYDLRSAETVQLVGIYAQNSGNKLDINTLCDGTTMTNIYNKARNGTALTAGAHVKAIDIDIDGLAGDDSTSFMTGIYLTSADTTGSINNKAIDIHGTWDWAIDTDYSTSPVRFGGRVHGKSASITAANDLTLGAANLNLVSGNTQINGIVTTGWQAGSEVTLIFSGTPTVKHNTGSAGTAKIFLAGSADFVAAANSVLKLVYDGTQWQEISRKAA